MDNSNSSSRSDLIPSIAVVAAAILWGVFWIPVRGVERAGVGTVWTGVLIFGCSSLALFLPIAFRWRNLVSSGWNLQWAGVLSGSAFALYTVSLNMTDVVRVILLFYMTPLWSTLLGALFLGERITLNRTLALVLAFSGLMAILGAGYRIPLPSNLGDWFALASGLIWSFASVRLFQGGAAMLNRKSICLCVLRLRFLFGSCPVAPWI